MTTNAWNEKWSEWIEWSGGNCPLPDGTLCDVRYRDGEFGTSLPAGLNHGSSRDAGVAFWKNDGLRADIIAYRYRIKEPKSVGMNKNLKWLAKNICDWPIDYKCAQKCPDESYDFLEGDVDDYHGHGEFLFSRDEWLQARKDLGLVMSDEEEEMEAPEWGGEVEQDMVNHPAHYQSESGIECIDAIRACLTPEEFRGYCKGNSIKYAWRERHKGGDESLKKAVWYLNKATNS